MNHDNSVLEKVVRDEGVLGAAVSFAIAVGVAALRAAFADDDRA